MTDHTCATCFYEGSGATSCSECDDASHWAPIRDGGAAEIALLKRSHASMRTALDAKASKNAALYNDNAELRVEVRNLRVLRFVADELRQHWRVKAREMAAVARDWRGAAEYERWRKDRANDAAARFLAALHDLTDLCECPECGAWTSPDAAGSTMRFCDACGCEWAPDE